VRTSFSFIIIVHWQGNGREIVKLMLGMPRRLHSTSKPFQAQLALTGNLPGNENVEVLVFA